MMITWALLIVYATTNTPQLGMVGSGLSGIGATSIPGFKSEKTCLEAKEKVLEMKDLWKNNKIKPFGIDCIKVQ